MPSPGIPNETTYTVPANNGIPIKIPCTMMSVRRMEIYEVPALSTANPQIGVPALTAQGLQFQFAARDKTSTSAAPTFDGQWKVQANPGAAIVLGDQVNEWKGMGRTLGNKAITDPAGNTVGPSYPIQLLSQTAVATIVSVREYQ